MMWISGRPYQLKGVYQSWGTAITIGKQIKQRTRKRWFIRQIGDKYQLYIQK